jgi:hypothetical protein
VEGLLLDFCKKKFNIGDDIKQAKVGDVIPVLLN